MADRRSQQFPQQAQQAGFGTMPQHQPFSAMPQQQQMYPMTQQGFPTMHQVMMPQPHPGMFMAATQPNQNFAGFAPGTMPGQRAMPPPPPYTQTLAKNYHMKQHQNQRNKDQSKAEHQRQSESLQRQRQLEQQQKKFRNLRAAGGSTMNADSLIESILGKSKSSGAKSVTQKGGSAVTTRDDGFGDFMTAPTLSHDNHMSPVHAVSSPAMPDLLSVTTDHPVGTGAMVDEPKSQDALPTTDAPDSAAGDKKDQVLAMMLQCSDFSAPAKATTFIKKRSVNESTPAPKVAVNYQSSNTAHSWNASDRLTQLFTEPSVTSTPQPAAQPSGDAAKSRTPFVMPKWCTGALPVPTIYTQVLEASIREGKIDIGVVYSILIKSGLPRETLGHIWTLCNQHTPGELQTDELYLVLAMIAIAQNNLSVATLDILHRCPQAPVPYLGQPVPTATAPGSTTAPPAPPSGQQQQHTPASAPLVTLGSVAEKPGGAKVPTQACIAPSVGKIEAPPGVEENDFADFQCAAPTSGSFQSSPINSPRNPTERFAAFINDSAAKTTNPTDLIGPEDKYAAFKASVEMMPQALEAPEPPDVSTGITQDAKRSDGFADFYNAFDGGSSGDAFIVNHASGYPDDDFTTFQTAGSQNQAAFKKNASEPNDKYNALKSLVSNSDLFRSEPIISETLPPIQGMDEKHGDISGNLNGKLGFARDGMAGTDDEGWDDFKDATPVKIDWSDGIASEGVSNSAAETGNRGGWEDSTMDDVNTEDLLAKTIMSKVSTKPKTPIRNFFAGNTIRSTAPMVIGISPLDTQPPDFPPDDDIDEEFDDFGTFHGSGAGGNVSTLGCIDIDDDFGEFAKQPSGDSASFAGMKASSSQDFTGWGGQSEAIRDDVQSMNSLDFRAYPSSKTDSSASGDNQSVSSFEIPAVDVSRKVEISLGDAATNEIEKVWMEGVTSKEESCEPDMFPTSQLDTELPNDNEAPQKTWDMSEMMTQGGLTALTSDRYSELSSRPQESDRHVSEWVRCIDQCLMLLRGANDTFNSISSSTVCHEVLNSQRGSDYIAGLTEVYKVAVRIGTASKSVALINKNVVQSLKEVELLWGNLSAFLANSPLQPQSACLDNSVASLQTDNDSAQQAACGVCLLTVDHVTSNGKNGRHKLTYGGRQYHSTCANFWVNCVSSTLPALKIPELL